MISSFGIRIILLLLVAGGAVAITGDYMGRLAGRKHFRFLQLRPRHTAYIFTVFTGVLIVSITMLIILTISQDARTALFGMDKIRSELREKGNELSAKTEEIAKINQALEKSRLEITSLEKTKSQLKREIDLSRKSKVLFQVGEPLLNSVIKAGPEKDKLEQGLRQILSAADAYVRSLGPAKKQFLIFVAPEEFDRAAAFLQKQAGENIVIVRVKQNTLLGEVVPVYFEIIANRLIYKSGTPIADTTISSKLSAAEIEIAIKTLLSETHAAAKAAGIIPDPDGAIGKAPYSQIYALAKKIKASNKTVNVITTAQKDTYAIGPLEIDFSLQVKE
ncbi:MAG: DUF3084 domain-containing protein [Candidatus Margulisiibacteriota bacterium]